MLNLDVGGLEDVPMDENTHITITATVCGTILAVIWYFSTIKENNIAEEIASMAETARMIEESQQPLKIPTKEDWKVPYTLTVCVAVFYLIYGAAIVKDFYNENNQATLRKMSNLDGDSGNSRSSHVTLGPHSYLTLVLSVAVTVIILLILWLIKITPFERLIKITPIHKLIQILINSPDLDEDENRRPPSQSSYSSSREEIFATCRELEARMARLELCLGPLANSLERLSEHVEGFQMTTQLQPNSSSDGAFGGLNENKEGVEHDGIEPRRRRTSKMEPAATSGDPKELATVEEEQKN